MPALPEKTGKKRRRRRDFYDAAKAKTGEKRGYS
jgi:hypothetical protein